MITRYYQKKELNQATLERIEYKETKEQETPTQTVYIIKEAIYNENKQPTIQARSINKEDILQEITTHQDRIALLQKFLEDGGKAPVDVITPKAEVAEGEVVTDIKG